MRRIGIPVLLAPALLLGCAARTEQPVVTQGTLAELHDMQPDVQEVEVEQGLEQAMEHYRRFLEETPETRMTPDAMRRLADLQIEKQFGVREGDLKPREMAAPESAQVSAPLLPIDAVDEMGPWESDQDFEARTTAASSLFGWLGDLPAGPLSEQEDPSGPLEAIALYDRLLTEYPNYEHRDQVLYQKARAYDELGRTEEAIATMESLIDANPHSAHFDEVQFRRGEYFFTRRKYLDAEDAYESIIRMGEHSSYYELALYKLGWTFYKQELYEEALHRYIALLDYKVSIGYDFDQAQSEDDERRVADTFRVVSLSFSNLGGPESVPRYFATFGNRSYEERVYSNLGAHYLDKLRYDDAAKTYRAFVELYPFHRAAPHFSMRIVETFTAGEFPKLVLEAKREFATDYGLQAEYWRRFTPEDRPEVLDHLKANLKDLATHYHADYQSLEDTEDNDADKHASYREALRWYGDYLQSFPADDDSPSINYRLADLLLEHEDFGEAARQYERTAYDYEPHDQAAAAGYAAVFAHRERLRVAGEELQAVAKSETVASSLRFADAFPEHEHAAAVLGAAADDLYEMQDYEAGVESAQRVIDDYPDAEPEIQRSAWIVVAHGSFELADYARAELAYGRVLMSTPEEDDESRAGFIDNLAASIYKQGELANESQDYRAAADHFLRIRSAAPTSAIRATAEYDAGAALIRLEDWAAAAEVLEAFRSTFPDHELQLEATRQIAYAYRENGELTRAAEEYERIASESEDPAMRSEALLVAGDLYEQSDAQERALDAYVRYVDEFPEPIETAVETRLKIAEIYKDWRDVEMYHQELREIVRIDADAGPQRTARTRTVAARSALVLAEQVYNEFVAVKLLQPFEVSLQEKQQRMDLTIETMGSLVDYEIGEVTAAATFYMAETYFDFSRSLAESERPTDLEPAELAEYELVLEEEAFPFEEKAIDVHEKNLELLQAGVFNSWTEKSLGKLAELVPGRYAKTEVSADLFAIDRYVYLYPACRIDPSIPGIADASARVLPAEPTPSRSDDTSEGALDDESPR
ncbi:MAG: tetratricopeptide repeat protein [Acidobacteria bacterium]|nr:tetratricopeptide repeat protein [Acidobacteriota bacterium]NIM63153.1 tetratricopeptide repeat protein [Acidobacteriota bacterium]NIQ86474.1 tetratricopeptide repeat protein [Acidobacteriota bacterium]NIT10819.1 tetratricopeptide repeat protein [Acidobacteriota bacterium]